ncbi:hypothetical protein GCM10028801_28700 [Nocardioides maradonensis]
MCTKVPYPNRQAARHAIKAMVAKGWSVRSIHPCFDEHKGAWHITRNKPRGW